MVLKYLNGEKEVQMSPRTQVFLLPLLDISDLTIVYLEGIFVGDNKYPTLNNDYNVFIKLVKKDKNTYYKMLAENKDRGTYVTDYEYDDDHIVLVMEVPTIHKRDYDFFLLGNYTKLSILAKKKIIDKLPNMEVVLPHFGKVTMVDYYLNILAGTDTVKDYWYETLKSDRCEGVKSYNMELEEALKELKEVYPRVNPHIDYLRTENLDITMQYL